MSSTTTGNVATGTVSDLFPTGSAPTSSGGSTSTSSGSTSSSSTGANVYYLVFLGVLVVLLLAAAALAFRAVRLRRRYRTATQLAISRGEPLPNARDPYWGLGGLSGWTAEGLDRWTQDTGFGDGVGGRGGKKESRWRRPPEMFEAEVWDSEVDIKGDEKGSREWEDGEREVWQDIQPVTIHSLAAPVEPVAAPAEEDAVPIFSMGPRPRPSSLFNLHSVRAQIQHHLHPHAASQPSPRDPQGSAVAGAREIDRELEEGEELRVGVVIRMPREEGWEKQRNRSSDDSSAVDDDGDEQETGWEPGMELGVWEGRVGKRDDRVED